jgi:hypothetical protein
MTRPTFSGGTSPTFSGGTSPTFSGGTGTNVSTTFPPPKAILTVNSPIVPGQPLPITWSFSGSLVLYPAGWVFTVNVYITDPTTGEQLALNEAPITYTTPTTAAFVPNQVATLSPPTQRAAQLLYTVGYNTIQMVLETPMLGEDGTYSTESTATAVVQPDIGFYAFSPSTSPGSPTWNSPYHVIATSSNLSQYTSYSINSLQITELDTNTGNTQTINPSVVPTVVEINGQITVDSGPITKNWAWMNQTFYTVDGPFSDIFRYSASLVFTDQFGNVYQNVWYTFSQIAAPPTGTANTFGFNVVVLVDGTKAQAQSGAENQLVAAAFSQGVAATLAAAAAAATGTVIGIPAGVALGIAAGAAQITAFALQQAAQADANRANDPPSPDFLTREPVVIRPRTIAGIDKLRESNPDLARLLEASEYLHAAGRALDMMQAKLLGANITEDHKGTDIQKEACRNLARLLETEARRLPQVIAKAIDETRRGFEKVLPALKLGYETLQANGISSELREKLLSEGTPFNMLGMVEAALRDRSLPTAIVRESGSDWAFKEEVSLLPLERLGQWILAYAAFLTARAKEAGSRTTPATSGNR